MTAEILFHGTAEDFDEIDCERGMAGALWLSSSAREARSFAAQSAGVAWHKRTREMRIISARVTGRILVVDPMAEARRNAEIAILGDVETWDDAAAILDWVSYQRDVIRDAADEGYDAVRFVGIADPPAGTVCDQIAVIDAAAVEIVSVDFLAR